MIHMAARLAVLMLLCVALPAHPQDLEPRRWSQLPTGINFIGLGVSYGQGDIFLDPVLQEFRTSAVL